MWKEFREFALQGNLVDFALGAVIGSAFTGVVSSLVRDILLRPLKSLLSGADPSSLPPIDTASLISNVIGFLLSAFVVFFVVKAVNKMRKGKDAEPVEKLCPHCYFDIPIQATRCGHCTSQLTER